MTASPLSPRQLHRRRVWMLAGFVAVPVLAGLIWFASVRISNASAVRRLEARIRARGEPLTVEELQSKRVPTPGQENAADAFLSEWEKEQPAYWKAFRKGETISGQPNYGPYDPSLPFLGRTARVIPRAQPLSPERRTAAEAYLQRRAAHTAVVIRALEHPPAIFPIAYTNGMDAQVPHLMMLRSEAVDFRIQSLLAADRGDNRTAIEALKNCARVGRLIAADPGTSSQSALHSCLANSIHAAEQLFSRQSLPENQLVDLQAFFETLRLTNAVRLAFIGERASFLSFLDAPPAGPGPGAGDSAEASPEESRGASRMGNSLWQGVGLADMDRRYYLETMETLLAFADQGTAGSIVQAGQFIKSIEDRGIGFSPHVFSSLSIPYLGRTLPRFASYEGRRRAAVTALAVERFRLVHGGALPEKLEELVPQYLAEVPKDPFDDAPVRFLRLPVGYVIYSIGPDLIDDHGREFPGKVKPFHYDQTFFVER